MPGSGEAAKKKASFPAAPGKKAKKMARETGLEPATSTVTGWHSNQLSYSPAPLKRASADAEYPGFDRDIRYTVCGKIQAGFRLFFIFSADADAVTPGAGC